MILILWYKGKSDRSECENSRGKSLLSIPGKVYGRILIEKVCILTEGLIREEQCGFMPGRGCVCLNQRVTGFSVYFKLSPTTVTHISVIQI